MNIFAYTQPGHDYPAYVSINRDGSGYRIAVRSAGNGGQDVGEIHVTPEILQRMAIDVLSAIGETSTPRVDLDAMVNRFLGWTLPRDFGPDAGISFSPTKPDGYGTPWWPSGTNLLTADQARQMFEYCTGQDNF